MLLQIAVGAIESFTVTVAVQVAVLPLLSVTVKVTPLAPLSAQVKLVSLSARLMIPQASLLLLSIAAAVIVAFPEPSRKTVAFWQLATGGIESFTVTTAEQVSTFPELSVTVKVTEFVPTFAQAKLVIESMRLSIPQTSLLPLSMSPVVIVADPEPSKKTVMFWQTATGGVLSSTVTVAVQVLELLLLSVTVKVTELAPTSEQVKSVSLTERFMMPQASELLLSI